ncbi:unnamed protein product [Symbiodinium pilosum]|uniref:Uncharacterized protein n=1 Tax=Symbiodinium pilosum TaxID=2952 RepID=A0A812K2L5_SYMPI|nr:unnamed protein product [Symbiodinium pilosum]
MRLTKMPSSRWSVGYLESTTSRSLGVRTSWYVATCLMQTWMFQARSWSRGKPFSSWSRSPALCPQLYPQLMREAEQCI